MKKLTLIIESPDVSPLPFIEGMWIIDNDPRLHIGQIQSVYWHDDSKEWVMDVVFYSHVGRRIGSTYPGESNPSKSTNGFESACPCANFKIIKDPVFPVDPQYYLDSQNSTTPIPMAGDF